MMDRRESRYVWGMLVEIFGKGWISKYGAEPNGVWRDMIASYPAAVIDAVLRQLMHGDGMMPNVPSFRRIADSFCRTGEDQAVPQHAIPCRWQRAANVAFLKWRLARGRDELGQDLTAQCLAARDELLGDVRMMAADGEGTGWFVPTLRSRWDAIASGATQ